MGHPCPVKANLASESGLRYLSAYTSATSNGDFPASGFNLVLWSLVYSAPTYLLTPLISKVSGFDLLINLIIWSVFM